MRQRIQRDSDVEVVFELTDKLEHLQRIEPEVGKQLTIQRRFDGTPAQTLEGRDRVSFEPIGERRDVCARRGFPASGIR